MAINRREFIKIGTFGLALQNISSSILNGETVKSPIVLSTWEFGLSSNDVAWEVLKNGGSSLDAVEAGARIAEGDPEISSVGFGGLPDEDGKVTLDACIMDHNGDCGSVAFLQNIKHPISVARKVMQDTKHVILVGEGAKQFAISKGFEETDLLTEKSYNKWKEWKKKQFKQTPHDTHDTISILARDSQGKLSGACTTSGWAYKLHGRVGDSPIIGAGLFVDNEIGCAAATGLGEEIIKTSGSFLVVELMRQGYGPNEACKEALKRIIKKHKGDPDFQVAYVAMRKDGKVGSACLKWSFEYALRNKIERKLYKIKGMI